MRTSKVLHSGVALSHSFRVAGLIQQHKLVLISSEHAALAEAVIAGCRDWADHQILANFAELEP